MLKCWQEKHWHRPTFSKLKLKLKKPNLGEVSKSNDSLNSVGQSELNNTLLLPKNNKERYTSTPKKAWLNIFQKS